MSEVLVPIGVADQQKADAVFAIAAMLIPHLRRVAREKGYCLATHGSLRRDIDLIAVPWRDYDVAPAFDLMEAMRSEAERVTGKTAFSIHDERAHPSDYTRRQPEPKPHGRLGWSIHLAGAGCYIDLSVMPTREVVADWAQIWRVFNRVWKHAAEFSIPLGYVRSEWIELQRQLHEAQRGDDGKVGQ